MDRLKSFKELYQEISTQIGALLKSEQILEQDRVYIKEIYDIIANVSKNNKINDITIIDMISNTFNLFLKYSDSVAYYNFSYSIFNKLSKHYNDTNFYVSKLKDNFNCQKMLEYMENN
jgi:hypothetical protein